MKRVVISIVALGLLAGGCADTEFTRANTDADQQKRDTELCRRQVNGMVARDRNIDDDISNSIGASAQRVRPNDTLTRAQMDSRGETTRTDRLMESCMRARGYSAAGEAAKQPAPDKKP